MTAAELRDARVEPIPDTLGDAVGSGPSAPVLALPSVLGAPYSGRDVVLVAVGFSLGWLACRYGDWRDDA
jgi:hypothetical protein